MWIKTNVGWHLYCLNDTYMYIFSELCFKFISSQIPIKWNIDRFNNIYLTIHVRQYHNSGHQNRIGNKWGSRRAIRACIVCGAGGAGSAGSETNSSHSKILSVMYRKTTKTCLLRFRTEIEMTRRIPNNLYLLFTHIALYIYCRIYFCISTLLCPWFSTQKYCIMLLMCSRKVGDVFLKGK